MLFRLVTTLSVAFLATSARADLPDLPLTTLLAGPCAEARAALDCPACTCEPYTSPPLDGTWDDDEPMRYGIVGFLKGEKASGEPVSMWAVFFGNPSGFTFTAFLGQGPGITGNGAIVASDVNGARTIMDMCAGACTHDPVGLTHMFEVKSSVDYVNTDDMIRYVTSRTELVVCYELDKAPTCWGFSVAETNRAERVPQSPKEKAKLLTDTHWARAWSLGFDVNGGVRVDLAKGKGKGQHAMSDEPAFKRVGKHFLKQIDQVPGAARFGKL